MLISKETRSPGTTKHPVKVSRELKLNLKDFSGEILKKLNSSGSADFPLRLKQKIYLKNAEIS